MQIKRDNLIDLMRFIAIVLMVFAHANMILNAAGNPINVFFKDLGNFICFALFLFCFGASARLQFEKKQKSYLNLLRRISFLYLAYLIIGVIVLIDSGRLNIQEVLNLAIFIKLPAYGEFIIAFIMLEILYFFFGKYINLLSVTLSNFLIFSILFFILGDLLKNIDFGVAQPFMSLIWGSKDYFSFPILQYSVFFLGGIFYASNKDSFSKLTSLPIYLITSLLLYFFTSYFLPSLRWPPNITYLLGNISVFIFIFLIVKLLLRSKIPTSILSFIVSINHQTVHILYTHILLLYLLRAFSKDYIFIFPYLFLIILGSIFFLIDKVKSRDAKTIRS